VGSSGLVPVRSRAHLPTRPIVDLGDAHAEQIGIDPRQHRDVVRNAPGEHVAVALVRLADESLDIVPSRQAPGGNRLVHIVDVELHSPAPHDRLASEMQRPP
jgi:hypothetical protein